MTPEEIKDVIKETVYLAQNSTKQENSGLITHLQKIMQQEIAVGIEKNVNGKIRNIDKKIDDYISEDNKWKESVTPSIETMKRISNTSDGVIWLAKLIVLLGAVGTALYAFYQFIINH